MVFPEYGLTSTSLKEDSILDLTQLIPHPSDRLIPCSYPLHTNYTKVLGYLSCGAADLGMYLVIDLAEQVPCDPIHYHSEYGIQEQLDHLTRDEPGKGVEECSDEGYIFYNTQVVLDPIGMVVTRYRKKHLFLEPKFTPGTEADSTALFTTDFGVTFSLQICFDIMYASPGTANVLQEGVRDVAMSTAWIDELPFLTAPQILRGWSAGLGVNLLVANYHQTSSGMLGSGIFPGISWGPSTYTYDHHGGTALIIANLTTVKTKSFTVDGNIYVGTNQVSDGGVGGTFWVNRGVESEIDELPEEKQCRNTISDFKKFDIDGNDISEMNIGVNGFDRPLRVKRVRESGQDKVDRNDYVFIHEDLSRYTHTALPPSIVPYSFSLCHENFCCAITYSLTYNYQEQEEIDGSEEEEKGYDSGSESVIPDKQEGDEEHEIHHKFTPQKKGLMSENMQMGAQEQGGVEMGKYLLLVYSGVVEKGGGVYSMYTQVCSVVYCLTNNITSCALIEDEKFDSTSLSFRPIHIRARFSTPFVYPSVLMRDLTLLSEDMWSFNNNAVISTTPDVTPDNSTKFNILTSTLNTVTMLNDSMTRVNSSTFMMSNISYDCEMFVDIDLTNLLTQVLFGRWYDRDPAINTTNGY